MADSISRLVVFVQHHQRNNSLKNQQPIDESATDGPQFRIGPIPEDESALGERVAEVISAESTAAFARKSGIHESTLRSYVKRGVKPGLSHLVAIADAGNVSLVWLATGRGPKKLTDSALEHSIRGHDGAIARTAAVDDLERLQATVEAVEKGLRAIGRTLPPAKYAELVVAAYQLMSVSSSNTAQIVQFIKAAAR